MFTPLIVKKDEKIFKDLFSSSIQKTVFPQFPEGKLKWWKGVYEIAIIQALAQNPDKK